MAIVIVEDRNAQRAASPRLLLNKDTIDYIIFALSFDEADCIHIFHLFHLSIINFNKFALLLLLLCELEVSIISFILIYA